MDFDIDGFCRFAMIPIPEATTGSHVSPVYDSIMADAEIVKGIIEQRIGALDYARVVGVQFAGNNTAVVEFDISTYTEVDAVSFTEDGYEWIPIPSGSYTFSQPQARLTRNTYYKNNPNYDLDPYNSGDPETVWPMDDFNHQGNLRFTGSIGWGSWDELPSNIQNAWFNCVKIYRDALPYTNRQQPTGGPAVLSSEIWSSLTATLDRFLSSRQNTAVIWNVGGFA